MENTCFPECKQYKKRFKCRDYVEAKWVDDETQEVKIIEDCATRRNYFMLVELKNRLIGVQKASEQERNKMHDLTQVMCKVVETIQDNPNAVLKLA